MKTTKKEFSVICVGHFPNRTAAYVVKKTSTINTKIAEPVYQSDTYEDACLKCKQLNKI